MAKELPPLSLYVHIPWCERKCPYCDFNSHENKDNFSEAQYIDCLIEDFIRDLPLAQERPLESIFIGGGTPSLVEVSQINRLLENLAQDIEFSSEIEITLEANPASSQDDYFKALSQTHVNRVSLGVQSFQKQHLAHLGRLHSSSEAELAIESLATHFNNFNIDLMFGLSDQSIDQGLKDLEKAIAFAPTHLSWYQLTIEPNTVFYRDKPVLPNEDLIFDLQQAGQAILAQQDFEQYEISAYSKTNKHSKHNLNYWNFGDYLAIGAGAHGKITHINDQGQLEIKRYQKTRMPQHYIDSSSKSYIAKQSLVEQEDLALEFFMNTLRLNQACDLDLFENRTGLNKTSIQDILERAGKLGLVKVENNKVKKQPLAHTHLDSLLELF